MPTRNRAHLLPYALRSALEQDFDDYEVVVVANDCHDRTRDVVREMHDDRVRYFETDRLLTMPDNYDFAWTKARGTYVTYLPDDDALVPSALRTVADQALDGMPPIVSWEDAPYYYPDWHDPRMRNLLLVSFYGDTLIEDVPSEVYRRQCAEFSFTWSSPLPKIYNCVANRETLDGWKSKLGRLFFPGAPDYAFAWIVSHVFPEIRVVHRPLSVRGISDHSAGSNAGVGTAGREFLEEFGAFDLFSDLPVDMPTTVNLLAATFLRISPALRQQGIVPESIDQERFLVTAAKQLQDRECRELLPDRERYFPGLLAAAGAVSQELRDTVQEILAAPAQEGDVESIRAVRDRTARMALEYGPNTEDAVDDHLGDEACARCVLGLERGLLAGPDWDGLYVFGDEIGIFDPYGASRNVDAYHELLMSCRNKRKRALEREATAEHDATRGRSDRDTLLQQKERMIADLSATANERLRLIEQAEINVAHVRDTLERLTNELQEKEQMIADLSATAQERLSLVEQANTEADRARAEQTQMTIVLQEKEHIIADLTATAQERLRLVEQLDGEAAREREARARATAELEAKERMIADLKATADERLRLIQQADSVAARAHDALQHLTVEVQKREQIIASLDATAGERLRLIEQLDGEAAREREARERLDVELEQKERIITDLMVTARERLELINRFDADARRVHGTSTPVD